ncbi:MAG: hypothetical protein E7350_00035 [Clostridiales bacterium]|nr:hypothetical protein [Clostridiales bacterium]
MEHQSNFISLINKAYENVRMGSYAIDCIMERIENPKLAELMRKQNKFYLDSTLKIQELASQHEVKLSDVDVVAKTMSFVSIKLKTLTDNDSAKLSEMLVRGTTMGITDAIRARREYPVENTELTSIVDRIISHEEEFVDSLKTFL